MSKKCFQLKRRPWKFFDLYHETLFELGGTLQQLFENMHRNLKPHKSRNIFKTYIRSRAHRRRKLATLHEHKGQTYGDRRDGKESVNMSHVASGAVSFLHIKVKALAHRFTGLQAYAHSFEVIQNVILLHSSELPPTPLGTVKEVEINPRSFGDYLRCE